jgi:hypothetical protein
MRVLGVGNRMEVRRKSLEITVLGKVRLGSTVNPFPASLEEDLGRTEWVLFLLELLLVAGA